MMSGENSKLLPSSPSIYNLPEAMIFKTVVYKMQFCTLCVHTSSADPSPGLSFAYPAFVQFSNTVRSR